MKTVILCGGMGTRIRDVNENMPKPMIPIGRQPMLWHNIHNVTTPPPIKCLKKDRNCKTKGRPIVSC